MPTSQSIPSRVPSRTVRVGIVMILALALIAGSVWWGLILVASRYESACREAQKAKRWEDLEANARRWSSLSPSSAAPWLFLADAVQHQQRFAEAAEYLGKISPAQEEYQQSQMARIKLLFGPANLPFEAEQVCKEFLASQLRAPEVHALLIQFYTVTLQRTKLRQQIASSINSGQEPPDAYVYYFLIDSVRLGNGVALSTLWLNTNPDNEILEVAGLLHGDDSVRDHDEVLTQEEIQILTEKENQARSLLRTYPHNANLLAYLADQELSKGRVEKVIELMSQTLSDTEADPRFWRFKGWIHFTRQEYDEAEKAYEHAISLHPMDWLTLHRLAEVKRTQGDFAEVSRLESLVERAHAIRMNIRELKSVINPPMPLLYKIGRLAKDVGDTMIAEGLAARLGPLDDESSEP